MLRLVIHLLFALLLIVPGMSAQEEDEEPRAWIEQPTNNAIVPPTFTVKLGATGIDIAHAGRVVDGEGHFHILVDREYVGPGDIIPPTDESYIDFYDGTFEKEITLEPGTHTLRLQLGNGAHQAFAAESFQQEIVVTVVEDAPEQAVRFVTPTDGAIVPPAFPVKMAATGFIIEPAGEIRDGAGHFHILVDEDYLTAGEMIPLDTEGYNHYGSGVIETELTLEPGEHTLRLQAADGAHMTYEGDQFRDEITVTVVEDAPTEQVMFIEPVDGASVTSPFVVRWAASGFVVEPAGAVIRDGAGHLHVLINEEFTPDGEVIPADETHLHFGKAQLETELELEPGEYTLRLLLANGAHQAYGDEAHRDEITITVVEE